MRSSLNLCVFNEEKFVIHGTFLQLTGSVGVNGLITTTAPHSRGLGKKKKKDFLTELS